MMKIELDGFTKINDEIMIAHEECASVCNY